ncbi:MAG: F0F1 ATP synthase subunit delta [Steroidobacteraceae bacterium]
MAENATIARPYARAAFEHARAASALPRWSELLGRASVAVSDTRVAPLLGNPHVRATELVGFIGELAGVGADQRERNFLQLLAENRRLALLPEITAQYELLRAEVENTVDVTVTSAQPLTGEQAEKLKAALTKRLKRTVRLEAQVDPSLIGGAIVRAGDFVVDGSLRGRVERLGNTMAGG